MSLNCSIITTQNATPKTLCDSQAVIIPSFFNFSQRIFVQRSYFQPYLSTASRVFQSAMLVLWSIMADNYTQKGLVLLHQKREDQSKLFCLRKKLLPRLKNTVRFVSGILSKTTQPPDVQRRHVFTLLQLVMLCFFYYILFLLRKTIRKTYCKQLGWLS